jgi:hypothetical protein
VGSGRAQVCVDLAPRRGQARVGRLAAGHRVVPGDTLGDTRCPFVSPRGHLRPHEHERPRRANPARALEYRRFQVRAAEDVNRLGEVMLYRAELLPRTRAAETVSGWCALAVRHARRSAAGSLVTLKSRAAVEPRNAVRIGGCRLSRADRSSREAPRVLRVHGAISFLNAVRLRLRTGSSLG